MNKVLYYRRTLGGKPPKPRLPEKKLRSASSPICPYCGNRESRVVDTRQSDAAIRRRRLCLCGNRFTTYECVAIESALDFQI